MLRAPPHVTPGARRSTLPTSPTSPSPPTPPTPQHALPRRQALRTLVGVAAAGTALLAARPARAFGFDVQELVARISDGAVMVDLRSRLSLSHAVEEALHRGVPIFFWARATVYRERWYWRDARVARAWRNWRLAWQPLAANWRVTQGALSQSYATLPEAIAAIASFANWRVAEPGTLEPGSEYYLEFIFRLDESQLPGPMQFGLTGQGEWSIGVERTLRLQR